VAEYVIGIDVGTTYTGAAVVREGRAQVVPLGNRSSVVPTVILLREDHEILTGESADRRAVTDPDRVAREFKRRLGDTTPLLLGGTPMSPQALVGRMLRWVIDRVAEVEGEQPSYVALSHPANWGPYKLDLLDQAVRLADLDAVATITEPEAAARYYASNERMETGDVVAVYDLGGGTFDTAVLRKTDLDFEILGSPEGIEHLGGIDIDEAVFGHVARELGDGLTDLDQDDPATMSALVRLRRDCVEAKEALSLDHEVSIPVLLPGLQTTVILTREGLEKLIRPILGDTIQALHRALRSADVEPDDLASVLLVGGASRMPIVAEMVTEEIGRRVVVDAHPKHAVALGTALAADLLHARERGVAAAPVAVVPPRPSDPPAPPAVPPTEAPIDSTPESDDTDRTTVVTAAAGIGSTPQTEAVADETPNGGRRWIVAAAAAAIVVAGVVGFVVFSGGGDDSSSSPVADSAVATAAPADTVSATEIPAPETTPETTPDTTPDTTAEDEPAAETTPEAPNVAATALDTDIARLGEGNRLPAGVFPDGVARDASGDLWVAATASGEVFRIDPVTGARERFEVGSEPLAVTTSDSYVWVTLRSGAQVARFDPASSAVEFIAVSESPSSFGWGAGSLWVTAASGWVDRLNPETLEITASIALDSPNGVAVAGGYAWVSLGEENRLAKIDVETNQVIGAIDVGERPDAVATDGEAIWVTHRAGGTVWRIDVSTDEVTHRIPVGTAPSAIAIDGDRVWVVDNVDGTLTLIDRLLGEVVSQEWVGAAPLGVATTGPLCAYDTAATPCDSVWITLSREDTLAEVRIEDTDTPVYPTARVHEIVATPDGRYEVTFGAEQFTPDSSGQFQVHLYWNDVPVAEAGLPGAGPWLAWDQPDVVVDPFFDIANRPPGATAICIVVVDVTNAIADVDGDGTVDYDTGNCMALPDL
jgi:YVTN family beta-propeller protein